MRRSAIPRRRPGLTPAVALALALALGPAGPAMGQGTPGSPAGQGRRHRRVCLTAPPGQAPCHAEVVTTDDGLRPAATIAPAPGAYRPADLQAAYGLAGGISGTPPTVAVVAADDNPKAEADLAAYRSQFGLPACTTANGCFRKVNQSGAASPLPSGNVAWGQEIDLDLQAASVACSGCHILLVEAKSALFSDLGAAADTAAALGATAVSNSFGAAEFSAETSYEGHYHHAGTEFTASSGDDGYRVEYPAASQYVLAVGGTSLSRSTTTRGWTERAWDGAGSGCSAYVAKPAWQADGGCSRRSVADVAAVADPNTGMAVYDSYGSSGGANWYVFGGTSLASPLVAGIVARASASGGSLSPSAPYAHTGSLFDVTSGANASSCNPTYLCTARAGYDGPTGLGTPDGTGAFGSAATAATSTTKVVNGGFETGSLKGWTVAGAAPSVSTSHPHNGTYSALLGSTTGSGTAGDSGLFESVAVPAGASQVTLKFWYWGATSDTPSDDWQQAAIRDTSGATLASVVRVTSNAQTWTKVIFDLTPYRGQTVELWFNVHQDGAGGSTAMFLDDVSLKVA